MKPALICCDTRHNQGDSGQRTFVLWQLRRPEPDGEGGRARLQAPAAPAPASPSFRWRQGPLALWPLPSCLCSSSVSVSPLLSHMRTPSLLRGHQPPGGLISRSLPQSGLHRPLFQIKPCSQLLTSDVPGAPRSPPQAPPPRGFLPQKPAPLRSRSPTSPGTGPPESSLLENEDLEVPRLWVCEV